MSIFDVFCHTVDKTIFSKENRGETVAFIIDQPFIDDFCKKNDTAEKLLMKDVRRFISINNRYPTHLQVKGIIAVQIFAATKREDSDGITAANYRNRLSQVLLNWDILELQSWMNENQDRYWATLYEWCDKNAFTITKKVPSCRAGRYVQYPIQQAERLFTSKDLKEIAFYFFEKGLKPGEDITEKDFWKLINKRSLATYLHNKHGRRVIESFDLSDAYKQLFNYYLRWDGAYLDNTNKSSRVYEEKYSLFLSEDGCIDVRDNALKSKAHFKWEHLSLDSLNGYYSFKRDRLIVFKKSEDYEGQWEETRFIENQADGMAIAFINGKEYHPYGSSLYQRKYGGIDFSYLAPIYRNNNIIIYKFSYNYYVDLLYSEKRFFSLYGGLKVGRMCYLEGGQPFLQIDKPTQFWIDGDNPHVTPQDGILLLDFLTVGKHSIKFPGYRRLEFSIVKTESAPHHWDNCCKSWHFSKDSHIWSPIDGGDGIVGIDFSAIQLSATPDVKSETGILTKWAEFHAGVNKGKVRRSSNIAINLLN